MWPPPPPTQHAAHTLTWKRAASVGGAGGRVAPVVSSISSDEPEPGGLTGGGRGDPARRRHQRALLGGRPAVGREGGRAPALTNLPSLPLPLRPAQLCFGHCAVKTPRWFPVGRTVGRASRCEEGRITITLFFSEWSHSEVIGKHRASDGSDPEEGGEISRRDAKPTCAYGLRNDLNPPEVSDRQ